MRFSCVAAAVLLLAGCATRPSQPAASHNWHSVERCESTPFALTERVATLYRLSRIVALIDVVFLAGWAAYLTYASDHLAWFDAQADPYLRALQIIGLIGVVGAIVPVWQFFVALRERGYPWWTKFTNGLFALAALAFVWSALSLKLLTFSLNY